MKKNILLTVVVLLLSLGLMNCKSNKISCPAYGDNKPPTGLPKSSRSNSGVLPTDGHGSRTRVGQ